MPTRGASVTRNDGSFAWSLASDALAPHSETFWKLGDLIFFFFHFHKKLPSFSRSMNLLGSAESGKIIGSRRFCFESLIENKFEAETSSSPPPPWKVDRESRPKEKLESEILKIRILSSRKFTAMQLKLSICNRIRDGINGYGIIVDSSGLNR